MFWAPLSLGETNEKYLDQPLSKWAEPRNLVTTRSQGKYGMRIGGKDRIPVGWLQRQGHQEKHMSKQRGGAREESI